MAHRPAAGLADRVRHVLAQAGFPLMTTAEDAVPGLWVRTAADGVAISWRPSADVAAMARPARDPGGGDRPGTGGHHLRTAVHTAVADLLLQAGHTVIQHDGGVLVVDPSSPHRPDQPGWLSGAGPPSAAVVRAVTASAAVG